MSEEEPAFESDDKAKAPDIDTKKKRVTVPRAVKKRKPPPTDTKGAEKKPKFEESKRTTRATRAVTQPDDTALTAADDADGNLPSLVPEGLENETKVPRRGGSRARGGRVKTEGDSAVKSTAHLRNFTTKGTELDFGLHVKHLESPLMTFDSTVRALLKTITHGADIKLPTSSMTSCAECRGGGDLLCCDCCQFAFHVDCVDPTERGSFLRTPVAKFGLRSSSDHDPSVDLHSLQDNEWICPYCLSPPVLRYWKRGVPQFMRSFKGFVYRKAVSVSQKKDHKNGAMAQWCTCLEQFADEVDKHDVFPNSVLLAMTGVRRAIQRLGPAFQHETRQEIQKLEEQQRVAASVPDLPEGELAEPPDVKEENAPVKAPIMRNKSATDTDILDELDVKVKTTGVRRTRGKPIVPSGEDPDQLGAARMNVGAMYQVPSIPKFMTEALDLGCSYSAIDRHSVMAFLPRDERSVIPHDLVPAKGTRRLVYSITELRARQQEILSLTGQELITAQQNSAIPLADDELMYYIRQVVHLWPAWIQWPPGQEFALKILHHCRYDAKDALKLLLTDGMQFRPICDPPTRPYINKWRPRDKRGHISTVPYPPPTLALSLAGVAMPPN